MPTLKLKLNVTPKRVAAMLFTVVSFLLVANLVSIFLKSYLGREHSFFHTFYFGAENNLPTLYSFLTLWLCGVILWMMGSLDPIKLKRQTSFWRILSCTFFFLAIDELTSLHETLTATGRNLLGDFSGDGYLHFAWFVPYGLFFGFILLVLLKQFMGLPFATKKIICDRWCYLHSRRGRNRNDRRSVYCHKW